MRNEPATTAASHMPADLPGDTGRTLAGLLGVLDRADVVVPHQRPRSRRAAAFQPDAHRRDSARRVPLRSVPPAPAARSATAGSRPVVAAQATATAPATSSGKLHTLTRRAALWGAGSGGEHLAWRVIAPASRPARQAPERSVRQHRLRALIRRLALWGAGPQGEYVAWASAAAEGRTVPPMGRAPQDTRPDADRPVVLREMPSTPTIKPVASSPATALLPSGPASPAGPRGARPVPSGAVPVPGVRPGGRLERSQAPGWPSPARLSPAATGLVRARGDPFSHPVRGSPPPARRARSPGSVRSSFPPGPAPRSEPGASRA